MITTDCLIIGAGPCGLFAAFENGFWGMSSHFIDVLSVPGGQCAEIYPKKPIYDIPAFPEVGAQELVDRHLAQIAQFNPGFTFGEVAVEISRDDEKDEFCVTTDKGTLFKTKNVFIAAGLGVFTPRKPENLMNLKLLEDFSLIDYFVRNPNKYLNKEIIISGGGDSAVDWAILLAEKSPRRVSLVHRGKSFRAASSSVEKLKVLAEEKVLRLFLEAEIDKVAIDGNYGTARIINIKTKEILANKAFEYWIPQFGLSPTLGQLEKWGLQIQEGGFVVDTEKFQTNIPGIFCMGDIARYPGKLKLIATGYGEACMASKAAFKRCFPNQEPVLRYTTVVGTADANKKSLK